MDTLKTAVKTNVEAKQSDTNAIHSFTQDEVNAYCEHINYYLSDDADLKELLPIDPQSNKIFEAVGDGVLLCKLINKATPGTIDPRAINSKNLNIFKKNENLTLAINSARVIGCVCVNITNNSIIDKREHIILGLVWQIIKAQMLFKIDLKNHPYLIRLKKEEEEISDLLKLPKEELLIRWFNYHLENAKHPTKINNFSKDVSSGTEYTILLNQIAPEKCNKDGLNLDQLERCKKVIHDSKLLGVPPCVKPSDIVNGNQKLNLIFCAHLFNNCPGLTPTEQEKIVAAGMIDDDNDPEASREERVFRMWMNSLNIEDVYLNNMIQDLRDGVVLCKIMDKLAPGKVDMKKVSNKNSKFTKIQNANYAVQLAKDLHLQIVGIGGTDIVDGNKKLILAIVWQLMRKQSLEVIGELNEQKLVEWGNSRIPQDKHVTGFKDKSLKNSHFFFKIMESIEPRAINQDLITPGETDEEVTNNAKYAISVARKLGAAVFLVWEHIRDVNPKFLMTFTASLYNCAKEYEGKKIQ
ncbi:hypothetical protein ABPG72_003663 [Tetrahymena utriculariae]